MVVLAAVEITIGLMALGVGLLGLLCVSDEGDRCLMYGLLGIVLIVALVVGGLIMLDSAGVIAHP